MFDGCTPDVATASPAQVPPAPLRDPSLQVGLRINTALASSVAATRVSSPASTMSTCPSLLSSRTSPCGSFGSESDLRTPVTPTPTTAFHLLDNALKTSLQGASAESIHGSTPAHAAEHFSLRAPFPLRDFRTAVARGEPELDDVRWMTGVPRHMIGVFRADPFSSSDTSSGPPAPGAYTHTVTPSLCRPPPPPKRTHTGSPAAGRKRSSKRRRVDSAPPLPFLATGPQEMYTHEFRVHMQDCAEATEHMHARHAADSRAYAAAASDAYGRWIAPHPAEQAQPMDVDVAQHRPVGYDAEADRGLAPAMYTPMLGYPRSPPPAFAEPHPDGAFAEPTYHVPTPHRLFLPAFELSPSSLSSWEYDAAQHPQTHDAPLAAAPRLRTTALPPPRYALDTQGGYVCPLCERGFQLPNGLALHLKWHERVEGRRVECGAEQQQPQHDAGAGEDRPHEADALQSNNHWDYAYVDYRYDSGYYRPTESALFPTGQSPGGSMLLAPLDGLQMLAPIPFSQASWAGESISASSSFS
ncbi:hypothetical protein FA95DRAFT_924475 [Auriscalpium vulgare]|uniref:Uncharacterized protein n=1 Tax=Auriscalpium vulgare TaxID=40419 RepID=A0ACB8RZE3_9AGAM|nr:hypothetical protein FA95DRAFT_924475 [Auriscalpium vulgare]